MPDFAFSGHSIFGKMMKVENGGMMEYRESNRPCQTRFLIGNAFPLSLVRGHRVAIEELSLDELRQMLKASEPDSFWGHENTRAIAEATLGVPLKPAVERPAMVLDSEGYPMLDGRSYKVCYVLSPDYTPGFRPQIGTEVAASDIRAWHALRLTWD